ncbi:MAG: prepilin peptidase [Alphaproteobacteria bacterium]|nr:prepilin peptidase [Alphaproteobacteria bacterium]
MFDAIHEMIWNNVASGIILAIALGFAIGNYACSLVHRLPRGRLILDEKPYCGSCKTPLQTKDLFPVVSALLLRHRCRYCGQKYPVSHTWTELLIGLLFVLAFLQHGFGEQFLLIVSIGVFLITLAAIEANENIIIGRILLGVAIFGVINRVLIDHTIYGFIAGGFYGVIVGCALFFKGIKQVGHIYTLPKPAELVAIGGLVVGIKGLPVFLLAFAAFWLLGKFLKLPLTVAFSLAVMIPVMYPAVWIL